jgi:hypothetical protein
MKTPKLKIGLYSPVEPSFQTRAMRELVVLDSAVGTNVGEGKGEFVRLAREGGDKNENRAPEMVCVGN